MRIFELFSVTVSIVHAFTNDGWHVTSLDASQKGSATIYCDILLWDYKRREEKKGKGREGKGEADKGREHKGR